MKKRYYSVIFGFGCLISPHVFGSEVDGPAIQEIQAPIEKIFIPNGFDDNDNVEIVLKGTFKNTCYRVGNSNAVVNKVAKEITIEATTYAYEQSQLLCLQVLTDFLQPVKVGLLEAGSYKVIVNGDKPMYQEFKVEPRKTEAPDDFLYAKVENAQIKINFETGRQSLVLQGHHPYWIHGCQVITEVRTYRDPEDILVVLPISEVQAGEVCENQREDFAFEHEVGLPSPFTSEGMIHVRTLNGNSINRFVSRFL